MYDEFASRYLEAIHVEPTKVSNLKPFADLKQGLRHYKLVFTVVLTSGKYHPNEGCCTTIINLFDAKVQSECPFHSLIAYSPYWKRVGSG